MDGARFSKLCKDTGLVGSSLSTTDVDLIFARVKERGERRITFDQVCAAAGAMCAVFSACCACVWLGRV